MKRLIVLCVVCGLAGSLAESATPLLISSDVPTTESATLTTLLPSQIHRYVTPPLYSLVLVWSYDNAARWSFGPQGRGVKTSWAQVTDSYTGCLFKLPIGCNKVTFTIFWTFYGSGKYSYTVKFD